MFFVYIYPRCKTLHKVDTEHINNQPKILQNFTIDCLAVGPHVTGNNKSTRKGAKLSQNFKQF